MEERKESLISMKQGPIIPESQIELSCYMQSIKAQLSWPPGLTVSHSYSWQLPSLFSMLILYPAVWPVSELPGCSDMLTAKATTLHRNTPRSGILHSKSEQLKDKLHNASFLWHALHTEMEPLYKRWDMRSDFPWMTFSLYNWVWEQELANLCLLAWSVDTDPPPTEWAAQMITPQLEPCGGLSGEPQRASVIQMRAGWVGDI